MKVRSILAAAVAIAAVVPLNPALANDAAFNTAKHLTFPLTPSQIRQLKAAHKAVQKATNGQPSVKASALGNTIRTIDLTDGAPPQYVHSVLGYATVLMITGQNGAPWPIRHIVPGNSKLVKVLQPGKLPTSAVLVPQKPWISTNLSVYLKGRAQPVIVFVRTSADPNSGVDSDVNVMVDGNPPGTAPLPVQNQVPVSDQLQNAVHYAPGPNWKPFPLAQTADNLPFKVQMWVSPNHKQSIVRLDGAAMVFPRWEAQANSADGGVKAYEYSRVPMMFLVDDSNGDSYQVQVRSPTALLASQNAKPRLTAKPVNQVQHDAVNAAYHMHGHDPAANAQPLALTGSKALALYEPHHSSGNPAVAKAATHPPAASAAQAKPATWTIRPSQSMATNVHRWAKTASPQWKVMWLTGDWTPTGSASFDGSFKHAVTALVNAIDQQGGNLHAHFYSNHLLRIRGAHK